MSNFQEPVRDYSFSDARLIELALEKVAFARRDETELETVGIDAAFVDDLEDKAIAFGEAPSDDVERNEQREATDEKNEDADALRDKLKELRSAAKRAFGEKSTEYKRFNFKGLDKFSDSEILKTAMVAKGVATTYAVELAAKGYSATDNTTLGTLITTGKDGSRAEARAPICRCSALQSCADGNGTVASGYRYAENSGR